MMAAASRPTPRRFGAVLAIACGCASTGCGASGDASRTAPAVSPAPVPAPAGGTGLAPVARGDAAVLGVLAAMDENEIALARHGLARRLDGATGDFARQMLLAHQHDLEKARAMGAADSDAAAAMRARGNATLAALDAQTEENPYRNAFMAAMASEHAAALKTLDAELIPGARSEAVRRHLLGVRRAVAEHYERAQAVSASR